MKIIRAHSSGHVLRRARRDRAGARTAPTPAPLTILGDLVHNPTVLADLRARGIAIAHDVAQVRTHDRHGHRARRVGADARRAPARSAWRSWRRPARSCTSRIGRSRRSCATAITRSSSASATHVEVRGLTEDLDDFDVVLRRSGRGGARRTSAHRRGRPDDAADRAGAAPGRADSTAVSALGRPLHRHGLPADQAAPERRRRTGAPIATSSSSSAARTATTRVSW